MTAVVVQLNPIAEDVRPLRSRNESRAAETGQEQPEHRATSVRRSMKRHGASLADLVAAEEAAKRKEEAG